MPDPLQTIVQRMIDAGEPEDNIRTVIEHYKQQPAATAAPPPSKGLMASIGEMVANDPQVSGVRKIVQWGIDHPVQAGAMAGSALASGGASIPASIAASGLGAAGGAGIGSIANAAMGGDDGPKTAADVAKTMGTEGALGAAGEAGGRALNAGLQGAARFVYKGALRPSITLQREFPNIVETGLAEGAPVTAGGAQAVDAARQASAQQAAAILAAKDAERPAVKGLLPPAQGVELGAAPVSPTMPALRDPRSAGVLMGRVLPSTPTPGVTYPQMIGAPEILKQGLSDARSAASAAPLPGEAQGALSDLEQRFLQQRPNGMTLTEANKLKQAAQDLANSAYRAADRGMPINSTEAQFNKGVASGTRQAIEARAPEVAPVNQRTQSLIGLQQALENAQMRNGAGPLNPRAVLGDFIPGLASGASILGNNLASSSVLPMSLKSALIAALGGGG